MLYIFGYSYSKPFADMPKLRIITKHDNFKVLDGVKVINPQGVALELSSQALILKVPLSVIGSPDFILTSANVFRQAESREKIQLLILSVSGE